MTSKYSKEFLSKSKNKIENELINILKNVLKKQKRMVILVGWDGDLPNINKDPNTTKLYTKGVHLQEMEYLFRLIARTMAETNWQETK